MTTLDERADVDQEVVDAQQLVDDLEERVRNGDESIEPAEVISAQERLSGLRRFAQLRVEAAERRAAKAAEERRQSTAQQVVADVERIKADDGKLRELIDAAAYALRKVDEAAGRRWDRTQELLDLARSLPDPEGEFGVRVGGMEDTRLYAVAASDSSYVRAIPPKSVLHLAIHRALSGERLRRWNVDVRQAPLHAAQELRVAVDD